MNARLDYPAAISGGGLINVPDGSDLFADVATVTLIVAEDEPEAKVSPARDQRKKAKFEDQE
jgi:hypothetical protein